MEWLLDRMIDKSEIDELDMVLNGKRHKLTGRNAVEIAIKVRPTAP